MSKFSYSAELGMEPLIGLAKDVATFAAVCTPCSLKITQTSPFWSFQGPQNAHCRKCLIFCEHILGGFLNLAALLFGQNLSKLINEVVLAVSATALDEKK